MEMVATMALKPGMEVAEDVTDHRGNIVLKKGTTLDKMLIEKLNVNSIICINIMEPEDYVNNYFDKIKCSKLFKKFQELYFMNFTAYKVSVEQLITSKVPINNHDLIKIVENITKPLSQRDFSILDMLSVLQTDESDFLYTHGLNVSLICNYTASWFGLNDEESKILTLCGFYYDIGKFQIPENILMKKGKLTEAEFLKMKIHPLLGYSMLKDMDNIDDNIKLATLMHHERCDGSGYPQKIKADKINKFAKIIAILDSYEAMTSYRSYRLPFCPFKVIDILSNEGYGHYDTEYYLSFLERIVNEYIGKDVILNDGTPCKVVLINKHNLSKPMVVTEDNQYIDLSKEKDLFIDSLS